MLTMEKTLLVPPNNIGKMSYFTLLLLLQASAIQSVFGEDLYKDSTVLEPPHEFQCTKEGKFPVSDSCKDFYHCRKTNDGNFPTQEIISSCPSGMIFDTSTAKCLVPPLVTSRPQCLNGPATSASANNNCPQEVFEDITMSVAQTCQSMRDISKYVILMISSLPLRTSHLNYEEFNKIVHNYNAILTRSKSNVRVWRNGNHIFNDIESLFEKVMQFGNEFKRKYGINQERRTSLYISDQNKDDEKILELQEYIKGLEKDIEDLKEVLNKTSVPKVKSFLEMTLKNKQMEIVQKMHQINQTSPIGRELEEVTAFLEFVKSDTEEVRQKAESLENRLKAFYKNLENDLASFGSIFNTASKNIAGLLERKEGLTSKVADDREDLERLETLKKQKEAMLSFLNDAADSKSGEIREKIREIQSKEEDYLRQRNKLCIPQNMILSLLTFRAVGRKNVTACLELEANFNGSITEDVNKMEALNGEFSRINAQRFQLLSQIGKIMENMTLFHDLLEKDDQVSQTEGELKEFELLVSDLRPLSSMANVTSSAVTESIKSIKEVEMIFHAISENLTEMITKANAARTTEIQQITKTKIDSGLIYLLCQTEHFHGQIPGFANCHE